MKLIGRREKTRKKRLFFLLLISGVFQLIFLVAVRISFECDSLAYYSSAIGYRSGNTAIISPYRGPFYPLILNLFGITSSGNLYPLLIIQAILGCLMPILIYLLLEKLGKVISLIGFGIICVSTISFTSAKLILAEQFFIFFITTAIYFLARFLSRKDSMSRILFVLFTSLACFTRWEALALPIASIICFLIFSIRKRGFLSHTLYLVLAFFLIFTCYSGMRALFYGDIKMFGLQNGTGSQWLWRQYYSSGFQAFQGDFITVSGAYSGKSIQSIFRVTVDYVHRNPDEFETLRKSAGDSKTLNSDYVSKMQNTFGNIELLLNDAWKSATTSGSQTTFLMSRAVISKYGLVDGDRLLQKGAIDILRDEPNARSVFIKQGLALLGFGPFNIKERIQWFEGPELNIGGCLYNTKNMNFISQHNSLYRFYSPTIHNVSSYLRNMVRASFPIGFIFVVLSLLFTRRFEIFSAILLSAALINAGIVSLTGGGPYGKYDLSIFTYIIIGVVWQLAMNKKKIAEKVKFIRTNLLISFRSFSN